MIHWLFLLAVPGAQASDPYFPVVQNFKDVAEFTVHETAKPTSRRDWLLALNHQLSETGLQILSQYRKRHSECEAQLNQLLDELSKIRKMKIDEIMKRYHDGAGLAEAPQHCIYGRVYLVHPVINLLRLERGGASDDRVQMIQDLNELLQYIPNLQRNLETESPKENP